MLPSKHAGIGAQQESAQLILTIFYAKNSIVNGYGPGGMNNGDNGDEDDDENRQRQRNYSNVDDDDENDRWASTTAAIDDLDNGNVEDPRYSPMTAFNSGDDRLRNRKLEIFGRRATRQDILKKLDHLRRKMIDYYKNRQPPRSVSSPISPFDSAIENKMSELYALIRRS
uniref:Uncharacterized protein n=1 Tax=Romanomermis culicivorax TaxID=13658 RepID=A0A915HHN9_ROMCU